ncbi:hypothetical protein KY284_000737 [Solanum tuberosum]|nr:hypothetical protein KY284_000737 [Solanum tuberosum]
MKVGSPATSVCHWVGVTCGSRHQRVRSLNISSMALMGKIRPHIGNLTFLVSHDLSHNYFYGNLSQEIAHLPRLRFLNLGVNGFNGEGQFPQDIGILDNFEVLGLEKNHLTGSISISIFNISSLQMMSLEMNNLMGSLPREIGNLNKLRILYLGYNMLTSTHGSGQATNVIELAGTIPQETGILDNLVRLGLDSNQITGRIPIPIFNISSLEALYLEENHLAHWILARGGKIPDVSNLVELVEIYLGFNKFTGALPSELFNMSGMRVIELLRNNLTGSILPLNIVGNISLVKLMVVECGLKGKTRKGIGNLSTLIDLNLSGNGLVGSIPTTISNLRLLQSLKLSGNRLSGFIGDNQCKL